MTEPTPVEIQLQEMRDAGLPVFKGQRIFRDNKTDTPKRPSNRKEINKQILEAWLPIWCLNSARNYPLMSRVEGLAYLRSCARGLPVVVVGIGPSLDDNIEDLKRLQGGAFIIATDAALRPLAARNIKPHLVVTFDCKKEQHTLFDGIETKGVVLLTNSCADPQTIKSWIDGGGKLLAYNMEHNSVDLMDLYLPTLYPRLGSLSNHGTVGNLGVLLAYQMGANPIILVGMDLCYQKIGDAFRYRCKDFEWKSATPDTAARWAEKENKLLYDNDERLSDTKTVRLKEKDFLTDWCLDLYRQILIDVIGSMNVEVIDCSVNGILDSCGVKTMPLSAVASTFCSRKIEEGESVLSHLPLVVPDVKDAEGGN